MKTGVRVGVLLLFVLLFFGSAVHWIVVSSPAAQQDTISNGPKYVFLFLADGAGIPHMEITRQYNEIVHHQGLAITDKILKQGVLGLVTTHAADSLSTDSAAAATALASGCKANIGSLGVCADGSIPQTAMEIAKARGMRIGLITNSTVYDASPAAFVCHVPNRRQYEAILDRYLELGPEVLFGGGRDRFLPKGTLGSRRVDGTDMIAAFIKKGYRHVSNKQQLVQASNGSTKLLGLFSQQEMGFEIDRQSEAEPSIFDMTRAAIRVLQDGNPHGFFVLIENENIDTAAHQNDIAALVQDYRAFDRAVALAYEFYLQHPRETLIIVTSDHETGGLGFTLALKELGKPTAANLVAGTNHDLKKIHSVTISLKKAAELIGSNPTRASVDKVVKQYFPGFTLAPDIKQAILKRQPLSRTLYLDTTTNGLGMMVANNTQAYWQTSSHTNHPVFVAALGSGAERFRGYQDNADFGKQLKATLHGH